MPIESHNGPMNPANQSNGRSEMSKNRRLVISFVLAIVLGLGLNIRGGTLESAGYRDQAFLPADACAPVYLDNSSLPRVNPDCYRQQDLERQVKRGSQLQTIGFALAGGATFSLLGFIVLRRIRKDDTSQESELQRTGIDLRLQQLDEFLAAGNISEQEHTEARIRIISE